jgi:hypothetical protein
MDHPEFQLPSQSGLTGISSQNSGANQTVATWRSVIAPLFIVVMCFLTWRSFAVNGGAITDSVAIDSDVVASSSLRAVHQIESERAANIDKTQTWLKRNLQSAPYDIGSIVFLASLQSAPSKNAGYALSLKLAPTDEFVLREQALHWLRENNAAAAVEAIDQLLVYHVQNNKDFFPILRAMVEEFDQSRALSKIKSPWIQAFAKDVCSKSTKPLVWSALFANWQQTSLTNANCFIDLLIARNLSAEAHQIWLANLPEGVEAGWLFNGGFESVPSGAAFDWRVSGDTKTDLGFESRLTKAPGITGQKALFIEFSGRKQKAEIASQHTALGVGTYQFTGRVRAEALKSVQGARWALRCVGADGGRLIFHSDRVVGSTEWQPISSTFKVPVACPLQHFVLEMTAPDEANAGVLGKIWYDDLEFKLVE